MWNNNLTNQRRLNMAFAMDLYTAVPCWFMLKLYPKLRWSFRNAIGKLEPGHQHVFISFLSSQIRWSLTTPSSSHCPLCHRNAWLWEHFFSCPVILPALSSKNIDITSFKHRAIEARWEEVFSTVANVLLVWHFAIKLNCDWLSIDYNRDTFHSALLAVSAATRWSVTSYHLFVCALNIVGGCGLWE
jgi:hypothetical protein